MICYRDMTFCTEETCARFGVDCPRTLTEDVKEAARKWWVDDEDAPICVFAGRPPCYEEETP